MTSHEEPSTGAQGTPTPREPESGSRDEGSPASSSRGPEARAWNVERVRETAQAVMTEVEATPIVGDLYDWLRAIVLGAKDTAEDMVAEARRGAREAYEEGWRRYDAKTRYRRGRRRTR